jgi:serine/threonine protein kinase/tetratricopeptide (TPR) repeat protein
LDVIGRGGMGEVYLVADQKLNRRAALKVVLPEFSDDQARVRRFLREARMAASLSHPNIVTIFEIGEHEGLTFLAMEYIEGQSLRQRLEEGPLDLPLTLHVARQVVEALAAAHSAGVIHRDIKPENVMLAANGAVKVLDFGLARQDPSISPFDSGSGSSSTDSPTVTRLSVAGAVIGTLRYMSPEQLRGHRVGPRSDLFGVGIVLYEMLAGHPPFEAPNWADFARDLLSSDPKPLAHWNVAVPPEVERVVLKCLAKDPDQRHQSARDLAADLALLERGSQSGTLGKPELPPSGPPMTAHRTRKTIGWLLAALLVFALAAAGYVYSSRPKPLDSVAVLPFLNASGDPGVDYVADGLSETLRRDLGGLQGMTVPPTSFVQSFRGPGVSPLAAARKLQVSAVLAGNVQAVGQDLQLDVVLTTAPSGRTIWTQSYRLPKAEIVRVADRLWLDAAYQLGRNREAGRTHPSRLSTPEAYDLYLKAQSALARRGREDVQQSVRLFQEATEKDPSSALAYAGLAEAYVVLANFGAQPPVTVLPQAKDAARRAIQLDPTLAEAYLSYAISLALNDFDWAAAERSFRRSIELDPRSARTHTWFALAALVPLKRFEEAAIEIQRAVELDPNSQGTAIFQATVLYLSRRYDEAILVLNRIKAAPFQGAVAATTAFCLDANGQPEQAIRLLSKPDAPGYEQVLKSTLAYSYAVAGERATSERLARELESSYKQVYSAPCSLAAVYVPLRQFDGAMRWLHECRAQGDLNLRFLGVDPRWDPIRSDPRFQDLVRELGLP